MSPGVVRSSGVIAVNKERLLFILSQMFELLVDRH